MKDEKGNSGTRVLWINRRDKVISFRPVRGFERLSFNSHAEMLGFAMEKGSSGYRIQ